MIPPSTSKSNARNQNVNIHARCGKTITRDSTLKSNSRRTILSLRSRHRGPDRTVTFVNRLTEGSLRTPKVRWWSLIGCGDSKFGFHIGKSKNENEKCVDDQTHTLCLDRTLGGQKWDSPSTCASLQNAVDSWSWSHYFKHLIISKDWIEADQSEDLPTKKLKVIITTTNSLHL